VGYALIAFGIAILVVFACTVDPWRLRLALEGARPELLTLAVAALGLQVFLKAVRWRYMVTRLSGTVISTRFSVLSILAGVAAGSVTPARSFEVAKVMMLKGSYGTGLGLSTSAMIVERLLDVVFLVGAFLVAGTLLPRGTILTNGPLVILIGALIVATVTLAAAPLRMRAWARAVVRRLPASPALQARAGRLVDTLCESVLVWRQGRTLGTLALMTAGVTALDLARVSIVFWAMGTGLSPVFVAFTYAGGAILGMALLVPGGVGVTEVSQLGLITLLGPRTLPTAVAGGAVLLDRALSYYLPTLIGAAVLIAYHRYRGAFQ
jgi:uncharacterized protein (TIRG00374 family)